MTSFLRDGLRSRPTLLFAAFAGFVLFALHYFSDYGNWFIHPHQFEIHLPKLLAGAPEVGLRSFANIFQLFDPNENRPRFLAYAVIWANLHFRMWLYDWLVLFPPFSFGWLLELIVGPILLFRFVVNETGNRSAAWVTLIVYVTSIGFLSGFAMALMPSKPLTNVVFIAVLWLLSEAKKAASPGQMLHEIPHARRTALLLGCVLLAGLFLDEVPIFAFLLPLLFYPELFVPQRLSRADLARAGKAWRPLYFPPIIFIGIVLLIVPLITRRLFGYKFDYFASVLAGQANVQVGKSFFAGAKYGFGLESLGDNLLSFFGTALLPWQVAPLVEHPSAAGVITGMQPGLVPALAVLGFLGVAVFIALRSQGNAAKFLRRSVLGALLFVLFMSLLGGRHVPFITGYVYGCTFPVFLALIFGFAYSAGNARPYRAAIAGAAIVVACIQLVNFDAINRSWINLHNEGWTKRDYDKKLPIAQDGHATTRQELNAIWDAWKAGSLDTYLAGNRISSGAVFLVFELRYRDAWRGRAGK